MHANTSRRTGTLFIQIDMLKFSVKDDHHIISPWYMNIWRRADTSECKMHIRIMWPNYCVGTPEHQNSRSQLNSRYTSAQWLASWLFLDFFFFDLLQTYPAYHRIHIGVSIAQLIIRMQFFTCGLKSRIIIITSENRLKTHWDEYIEQCVVVYVLSSGLEEISFDCDFSFQSIKERSKGIPKFV